MLSSDKIFIIKALEQLDSINSLTGENLKYTIDTLPTSLPDKWPVKPPEYSLREYFENIDRFLSKAEFWPKFIELSRQDRFKHANQFREYYLAALKYIRTGIWPEEKPKEMVEGLDEFEDSLNPENVLEVDLYNIITDDPRFISWFNTKKNGDEEARRFKKQQRREMKEKVRESNKNIGLEPDIPRI